MNPNKEKLLKKTFDDYIELMLYDFPVERIGDLIAEDVSGYGTTVDEKFLEIKRFKKVVTDQREQSAGIEMHFRITPIHRRVSPDEDTAIFMDEFEITMVIDGAKNVLPLRLTSVFEFLDNNWKLVHIHGSKAVETEGDTWHMEEWKKKNEELQRLVDEKTVDLEKKNRELEIEAALERVRTVTMSMQKPDDLLDVCQIISEQLEMLNVSNIRNVQVAIIDESKKNYSNYQFFTAYAKAVFEETLYEKNPASKAMVAEMRKSTNSFFIGSVKDDELQKFRDWRKKYDQFPDPIMDDLTEVFYYFYSIGEGGLGLTTYEAISESELEIFKRFHLVFKLAYRRFMDIQQAEAQAKEARIEAALEKIRSRALAMRNSSEVGNVSTLLFSELEKMDINPSGFSIMIFDEENDKYELWRAKEVPHQGIYETFSIKAMFDKLDQYLPGFGEELKSSWANGKPFFIGEFRGKNRDSFLQANREMANYSDEAFEKMKMMFPDPTFWHLVFFKYGWFGVLQNEQLPDEDLLLIHRFAEVFDFAFTRFLDLQKAEAQAREAKIEAALERVRSRTMGMRGSDELQDAAMVLFQQVEAMGVPVFGCGFNIWDDDRKAATAWMAGKDRFQPPFKTSSSEDIFIRIHESSENGQALFVEEQEGEALANHYKYLTSIPGFKVIADKMAKEGHSLPAFQIMHCAYFPKGYLMFITYEKVPEAHDIFKRFTKVFDQTYTRFLDLRKAEAQAREALVELSLERIRAQVTAMQESSELLDIVVMMQAEFNKLGHEAHYFWHMRWFPDKYEKALTNGEGTRIGNVLELPRGFHGLKNMMDWEESDEPTAVFALGPDIAADYIDKMIKLGRFQEIDHSAPGPDEVREMGGLTFVMARTTHGEIGYTLPGEVPNPPEKDIATLVRFAGVFDLAYRRFEDLKSAERQNREAVKQSSLDRIRGQIASMRNATDLQQITPLIWNELKALEVPFFRCGVFIVDDKNKHVQVYLTTPEGNSLGVLDLDFEMSDLTRDTVRSWRQQEVYQTHWNKEEFIVWTSEMMKLQQVDTSEQYQGAEEPPESLHLHFIPFAQGMLYVGHVVQLEKEKIDLVKSLAEAFSFAYARYQDFVVLEEAKELVEKALSDLKATQTQLIHAEKMASLGELTAGIAHEIQNPLNFVNNFSEVSVDIVDELNEEMEKGNLEEVKTMAGDLRQNLEKISHHGKRASGIVKGMLEHSRSSTGQKEPTDINALADEYLRLAYHGLRAKDKSFNADFKTDLDENLPKINVIPQDIGRVLLNLINNAFYAVSMRNLSGKPNLTAFNYKPTVIVSTKNLDDKIEIIVKDNGNGIPEGVRDKIFQPFFTTKPTGQGTGLGLSMSYDIITKGHGGDIEVNSSAGEGSEFIIRLPLTT